MVTMRRLRRNFQGMRSLQRISPAIFIVSSAVSGVPLMWIFQPCSSISDGSVGASNVHTPWSVRRQPSGVSCSANRESLSSLSSNGSYQVGSAIVYASYRGSMPAALLPSSPEYLMQQVFQ